MMKKPFLATLLLLLMLLLALAGPAWAQVSPNYDLSWHVVSAGGNEGAASGRYMVHGTVSQFAIGPTTGTAYGVDQGYWYGIYTGSYLYLPLIVKTAGS
jgi:hypothetical protein